jgi:hypothetical protein
MNDFNRLVSLVQNKLNAKERPALQPVLAFVQHELLRARKVFYGGTAQNAYLPKKLQFYNLQKGLPDFDVYSADALAFVQRLVRKLRKRFHGFAEVRCALHPGTYKLTWNHRAILDVTDLPRYEMRRLRSFPNNLAPLSLIKANAYIELAMPDTAAFRWKKVFQRIQLLEKTAKKKRELRFKQSKGDLLNELVERAYNFAKQSGLPVAGVHAARYYLSKPFDPSATLGTKVFARLQVLSTEPLRDAQRFAALSNGHVRMLPGRQSSFFSPHKVFVQVQIDGRWYNWISVHQVRDRCVAVENGFVSLFYLLYNEYLHVYRYGRSRVPWLLTALVRNVSVKRLRVECYGNAPGKTNLKQQQYICQQKNI